MEPRVVAAAVLLALAAGSAQAQLFPDNEARKAIIELRAADEKLRQEMAAQNKETADQLATIKRSLLELSNQIEQLRAELARQRGANEQLARDVADLQRRQKDIAQGVDERMRGVDERMRKVEPQRVSLDGKEFLADPEEKRQFDEAMAIVRAGDFPGAASALQNFLRRYPQSGYGDASRFWLGNALYGKRDLTGAITIFRTFVANAPDHPRVPEALLAIANSQAENRDTRGARATLADLLKRYPDSEAAQAGKDRLATLR